MVEIRELSAAEGRRHVASLAEVLMDCVDGGASVSFMAPFSRAEAEDFFEMVVDGVQAGNRILLAAFVDAKLAGTVQLVKATSPNQPHRADVAKLLVLRSAREHGIGSRLMESVEDSARRAGRTLLVLDTATPAAEKICERLGWTRVGVIPEYALFPRGGWCDTTIFWKKIPGRQG